MDRLSRLHPDAWAHVAGYAANTPGAIGQVPVQLPEASRVHNNNYKNQQHSSAFTAECHCDAFLCESGACISSGSCAKRVDMKSLIACHKDFANTNACSSTVILTSIFRAMRNHAFSMGLMPGIMFLEIPGVAVFFTTLETGTNRSDSPNTIRNYSFTMDGGGLYGSLDANVVDARRTLVFNRDLSQADISIVNDIMMKLSNKLHPATFEVQTIRKRVISQVEFGLKLQQLFRK